MRLCFVSPAYFIIDGVELLYVGQCRACMCWTLGQTDDIGFGCATKLLLFLDCSSKKKREKKRGKSHFTQRLFSQLLCLPHFDSLMRAAREGPRDAAQHNASASCQSVQALRLRKARARAEMSKHQVDFSTAPLGARLPPCPAGGMRERRQTSLETAREGRGASVGKPEVSLPGGHNVGPFTRGA